MVIAKTPPFIGGKSDSLAVLELLKRNQIPLDMAHLGRLRGASCPCESPIRVVRNPKYDAKAVQAIINAALSSKK